MHCLSAACMGLQRLLSLVVWVHSQIGPARQARSYPEPSGPRERGFVERFKEHYGFIRWTLATSAASSLPKPLQSLSHGMWHVA